MVISIRTCGPRSSLPHVWVEIWRISTLPSRDPLLYLVNTSRDFSFSIVRPTPPFNNLSSLKGHTTKEECIEDQLWNFVTFSTLVCGPTLRFLKVLLKEVRSPTILAQRRPTSYTFSREPHKQKEIRGKGREEREKGGVGTEYRYRRCVGLFCIKWKMSESFTVVISTCPTVYFLVTFYF